MNINRNALIGAIKAGQAWLQWDDITYRSVLHKLTHKQSATKCTLEELQNVREYMHQQGFPRTTRKHGRKPKVASRRQAILSKIEALLADSGRSWQYAESIAERMFHQKVLEWLDDEQITKLLQALIIDARRRAKE